MGEKVGFTNCVFEKLCSSENTIFIVFSANTAVAIKKPVCWKTESLWKTVCCFWTWQNGVFGFVFEAVFFYGFVVCFLCVWLSCKMWKMPVFLSQFCGFWWGGIFLFIWVWKVEVFLCFLCLFFFCSRLVFVCFGSVFVLLLDCWWCGSCFVFVFCFVCLLFCVFVFVWRV